MKEWTDLLTGILERLAELEAGLEAMREEATELRAAGMWPAIPTEVWERRGNATHDEARYLRLSFPRGALPEGRTKYIGCDPARIATARRKTARRRRWEELQRHIERVEGTLQNARWDLEPVQRRLRACHLPEGLVTEGARPPADLVTKGAEWIRTRPKVAYDVGD